MAWTEGTVAMEDMAVVDTVAEATAVEAVAAEGIDQVPEGRSI